MKTTTTTPLFLLLCLFSSFTSAASQGFGINYGQIGNDLPSPRHVLSLLNSLNVTRVKLYDADPDVLLAFADTGIEFIVGISNDALKTMTNLAIATQWLQQHVQGFLPRTKISCVLVGNEVYKSSPEFLPFLLPAMQTLYAALTNLGLSKQVTVSSAHSLDELSVSYPPSSGAFRDDIVQYMQPVLNFHSQIGSPFLINAYPFFAYKANPKEIAIEYVLFEPNEGMIDHNTKLVYNNMLYAQIDAVYSAIKALGHTDIQIRVSETGWPSKGDSDEVGASKANAGLYNGNLLRRVLAKHTTPGNPSMPIDVHVFALFNEDLKPGPTSERNYGLFYPDGTPVYDLGLREDLGKLLYSSASKLNVFGELVLLSILLFIFWR